MRRIRSRFVVASSCLVILVAAQAARRPRYGGTLRLETSAVVTSLEPAAAAGDSFDQAVKQRLLSHVFETLVRLDEKGEPQPLLATSWAHDAARKRWVFTTRPNVLLHNGERWETAGGIAVDDGRPIEEILRGLADPQNAILVRAADGSLAGTGPFRIASWQPGGALKLTAHEGYWGGRPFLDSMEVRFGRARREQALDLEAGRADVIELPASEVRRAQQRGASVVLSAPVEVMALVMDTAPPGLEQALALAIDRSAIHNVLLQRTGTISGALLPYWLSGYSFVFPAGMDAARARELAGARQPLTFSYDQQNPLVRSIAERIMLNAGEAGIPLRAVPKPPAAVRLVNVRFASCDPARALAELAAALETQAPVPASSDPAQLYAAESGVLAARRVVPLFHLPAAYQLSPAVHGWPARGASTDRWRLDDVWLEERGRP